MTNNLKKCQKFAISNFSDPVTPRLSYPSWKIVRNIIGITACPRTSTRYLLKAQLSDPPVHVIWPVLRVHRQRVAIMFAISTCIYVDDPTIATSDPIANYEEHDIERCCIGISESLTRDLFDSLDHSAVLTSQLWNLGTCFYSLFVLSLANMFYMIHVYREFDSCTWRHL